MAMLCPRIFPSCFVHLKTSLLKPNQPSIHSNMTSLPHSDFDQLKQQVIDLFQNPPGNLQVNNQQQQAEIRSLDNTIGSQRFYFVVDMPSFEIIRCRGLQQWLGHSETDFTLKRYWKLVHPGNQVAAHTVFLQMAKILCTGLFSLEFMVQRYGSLTALRHRDGHYLLCKRIASVFQFDEKNRLTEYLNEFTVIGPYKGEPLSPSFFTNTGDAESDRGAVIMKKAMEDFASLRLFAPAEFQIARLLAYNPGMTVQQLAEKREVMASTIKEINKRFIEKARDHFHVHFPNAQAAADYLRNAGLL